MSVEVALLTGPARHTCRWAFQGVGNTAEIDHDSLDTIAFALNLRLEPLHLITVEWVLDILFLVSDADAVSSWWVNPALGILRVAMLTT